MNILKVFNKHYVMSKLSEPHRVKQLELSNFRYWELVDKASIYIMGSVSIGDILKQTLDLFRALFRKFCD